MTDPKLIEAFDKALDSIEYLGKREIATLRNLNSPALPVFLVFKALFILMDSKNLLWTNFASEMEDHIAFKEKLKRLHKKLKEKNVIEAEKILGQTTYDQTYIKSTDAGRIYNFVSNTINFFKIKQSLKPKDQEEQKHEDAK